MSKSHNRAFTLVELLVVIGIIALLISVLLPVLSGVQSRGRDIKCQSNLRQIGQAVFGYCAENKGSMPWGYIYNRVTLPDYEEHPDNINFEYISWAALVGKYMTRKGTGIDDNLDTDLKLNFPDVLQCPEAQQAMNHLNSYVMNFIVAVSPVYEYRIGGRPPQGQTRPALQTQLLKDSALVWDTAIRPGWERSPGFLVGADIDDERFWRGAHTPQYRYYSIKDPFARIAPGIFGQNRPVLLNVSQYVFRNIDPGRQTPGQITDTERWPYQGNLRFRHNKGTACNVIFADGSVRQFTAKMNSDKTVKSHDALRRYFMIKWPPGVPPNTSIPY
jgi:prepilin-type N-terminal cleavage/methylation domain-containing protein/prepilin-type processing-associated H-X9-DG protein